MSPLIAPEAVCFPAVGLCSALLCAGEPMFCAFICWGHHSPGVPWRGWLHLTITAQGVTDAAGYNSHVLNEDLWALNTGNDHRDTEKRVKGDGIFSFSPGVLSDTAPLHLSIPTTSFNDSILFLIYLYYCFSFCQLPSSLTPLHPFLSLALLSRNQLSLWMLLRDKGNAPIFLLRSTYIVS